MPRFAPLLLALLVSAASAQTVTVETIVPAGSAIDDALALGPDGALYGSRFGTFDPFEPGTTVTRVDLSDGSTSVYARGFSYTNGLAFADDGALFVASYYDTKLEGGRVSRVGPDGTITTRASAGRRVTVSGLAVHPTTGVLYVTSYDAGWVRTLSEGGAFEDVVSGRPLNGPAGLAFDDQGRLHVANFEDGKIFRVEDGALVPLADLQTAVGFLAYGGGRFFATGIRSHRVYAITEAGEVSVLAGAGVAGTTDGPGERARFDRPNGIAVTPDGSTIYVSEAGSRAVRRIEVSGVTSDEDGPAPVAALLPMAPNPAGAATTVRFRLGAPGPAELLVYDALGRRVRQFASGPHRAGLHAVALDMAGLASGAYVVTLRHAGGVESLPFVRR